MNSAPAVSVVMPVYNGERYLREAMESVLAQTFTDFEFLIVDNGSTDSSLEIIQSYADPRIRVLTEPERGLVPPLNKGIDEARGKYIARMDADDASVPERLMRQADYMARHRDTVLAGSWAHVVDGDSKAIDRLLTPKRGRRLNTALCVGCVIVHGSVMMRRDAVLAAGGYRSAFPIAEDYDLWLRLAEIGTLANIPEFLYRYRVHQGSTMTHMGDQTIEMYAERARRAALERCNQGRDCLGYVTSHWSRASQRKIAIHRSGPSMITLGDWALALMRHRHLLLGYRLLLRAVLSRPMDPYTWLAVCACLAMSANVQAFLRSLHQMWPSGAWPHRKVT